MVNDKMGCVMGLSAGTTEMDDGTYVAYVELIGFEKRHNAVDVAKAMHKIVMDCITETGLLRNIDRSEIH